MIRWSEDDCSIYLKNRNPERSPSVWRWLRYAVIHTPTLCPNRHYARSLSFQWRYDNAGGQSVWGFQLSLSGATHLSAGWQGPCCAIGEMGPPLRAPTICGYRHVSPGPEASGPPTQYSQTENIASPLLDPANYAQEIEGAFREMWRTTVRSENWRNRLERSYKTFTPTHVFPLFHPKIWSQQDVGILAGLSNL